MNIVKERAQRILKSDRAYKRNEMDYLLSVMKQIPQEELITDLKTLEYRELKAVVSCGVPGHAHDVAIKLLREKKRALELFISEGGIEAIMTTEAEEPKEEDKDGDEGVRSSESGRESDSGTLGETSTDSGTP